MSFKHEKYGNWKELSKYIWNLKKKAQTYSNGAPESVHVYLIIVLYLHMKKSDCLCGNIFITLIFEYQLAIWNYLNVKNFPNYGI